MNLIFLAAGFATRLEPLTLDRPKHLLPLKNGVFIDLLIDQLKSVENQFDRKILVTNERYKQSFSSWQESAKFKVEVFSDGVSKKESRVGAIGDLLNVLDQASADDDLLILASDYILKDFNFEQFLKFAKSKKSSATVAKKEKDKEAIKAGSCLMLGVDDRIVSFAEKPEEPFSDLYGAPYYYVTKNDLKKIREIPRELWDNCGQIVAQLLNDSVIYGFKFDGDDLHMTTLSDYEKIKSI